jgi:transcriptional regulator with XRE-family HTH domain
VFLLHYVIFLIQIDEIIKRKDGIMAELRRLLGLRIKELRKLNKLTQAQLAERIDMETTNLCKLENGCQLPKEENIEKIAKSLDVEVKDLFDFGHLKNISKIKKDLFSMVQSATDKETELYYRIMLAIKETDC